jgi:hypothetical protein
MIHSSSSDRQAVRTVLERRFGRAIPVTEEMIDAVLDALDEEGDPR